jgi:hypothetical protein
MKWKHVKFQSELPLETVEKIDFYAFKEFPRFYFFFNGKTFERISRLLGNEKLFD